jgi:uncharacterized protein YprB with RNaseH-like and TPR domain
MSKLGTRLREIMRGGASTPPQLTAPSVDHDAGVSGDERGADLPPSPEAPADRRSFIRLRAQHYGETATELEERSRGGGGQVGRDPRSAGQRLAAAAAFALGGRVHETPAGPCVVIEREYAPDHRHGRLRVGDCADHVQHAAPGFSILAAALPSAGLRDGSPPAPATDGEIVFLDIETTGLTGGAGTYAFLVGCGWFEDGAFRLRQFFMVGHALERALLVVVRERLESCGPLVTYNGKTFDVPVLETRFLYNRQPAPFGERLHLDMLHPARRLWRGTRPAVSLPGEQSDRCTLSVLERGLFAIQRTADVPGFEIPGRYFAFLRSGDARPLQPVVEHNRLDLVALAALTARASALLADMPPTSAEPRECLGLGRLLERAGRADQAELYYRRAADLAAASWHAGDDEVRVAALHALALRCRRSGRYPDAAAAWEAITRARRCPPALMREALEALAIHHEHRSHDLDQAWLFAERTRRVAGVYPDIDRRLARIGRKLGARGRDGGARDAPLLAEC